MNKTIIIGASAITALLLVGGGVWYLRVKAMSDIPPVVSTQEPTKAVVPPKSPTAEQSGLVEKPELSKEEMQKMGEDWWKNYQEANADVGSTVISEEPTPVVTEPTPPIAPSTALDSDSDGLTDIQETTIYKTDPFNADTDGDSFLDGNEVKSGYNPLGTGKCANVTCIP